MATILIFQHDDHQTPGRLGTTLRDHGFRLDVRRPDRDGPGAIPPDLDNVHGVVSLGGYQNPDDTHDWIQLEREFLKAAADAGLPTIGVCLGHQLLAQALGGQAGKMDKPEFGFPRVNLSHAGQNDTILSGVAWSSPQFMSHGYEVTEAPPGAAVLGSTDATKVAIFKVGHRAYGFQHHLEADRAIAEHIGRSREGVRERAGVEPGAFDEMLDEHYARFARAGDRVAVNLATLAFTFDALTSV